MQTETGFSLRRHLENKGVTTEEAMRAHLAFAHKLTLKAPGLSVRRYRPNPDNPNEEPYSFIFPAVVFGW